MPAQTKSQLIKKLSHRINGLSKENAEEFVEIFFEEISNALQEGETIKLPKFGNFQVRQKKARPGRNPRTGKATIISARRVVSFLPSRTLQLKITELKKPPHSTS